MRRSAAARRAPAVIPDALAICTVILSGLIFSAGTAAVDVPVGVGFGAGLLPGRGVSSRIDFHNASAAEVHCTRLWSGGYSWTGTVTNRTWEGFRPIAL